MRKLALFFVGACAAEPPSTSLADLQATYGDVTIEVVAREQVNIQLFVTATDECPYLGDAVATFNGERMHVSRGGYDTTANGCYPIAFWFDQLPDRVRNREGTLSGSQLQLVDDSATWSINTSRLFASRFEIDTAASQIIWRDVDEISTARVSPAAQLEITGNVITYPAGRSIDWVEARAHPAATRCDGPSVCIVDLQSDHDFPVAP